jgi:tetratricopeptide (TPR) repeat protein
LCCTFALAAASVLLTTPTLAAEDPQTVLVAGNPPLTPDVIHRFGGFFEWVLEAPMTAAQQKELRDSLVESWQQGDRDTMDSVQEILKLERQSRRDTPAARDLLRAQIQPAMLESIRANADKDQFTKWLQGIYEAAHTPLAPGDPPLTRQVVDAYAEVMCFEISQVMGRELQATPEVKDQLAKSLVAGYPNFDAAARQQLAKMPLLWAAMRVAWTALPAAEQEGYRRQWAASLAPLLTARTAPPPAGPAAPTQLASADALGYVQRATAYLRNAQYDLCVADCDRALQLDPRCVSAYTTRAQAWSYWTFDNDKILRDANAALAVDPNSWLAYDLRGGAYYSQGERAKAEADWAKMRQLKQAQDLEAPPAPGSTAGQAAVLEKMQEQQRDLRWLSNMAQMSHDTSTAIISNIGGGWTYEYRP